MKNVLIIDGHEDHRILYNEWLGETFNVVVLMTWRDVREHMRKEVVDLLVYQFEREEEDGFKALQKIRDLPMMKEVPVIAVTAYASEADRERYLKAGFDEFVVMPILDEKDLLKVLGSVLCR